MNKSRWRVLLVGMLGLLVACQSQQSLVKQGPELHTLGMDAKAKPIQISWTNEITGTTQTVTATVVDGKIVYQGEVLRDVQSGEVQIQSAIVTTRKWPNNTVPYVVNATSNTQSQVQQAVDYYNANTNLRWVARTTESDYVEFFNGSGCWSYVGRIGGKQQVSLGSDGCGVGATLHEMGHALGLHHEQSRPDRDTYVRIRYDLIPDNIEYNWDIATESKAYQAYDYYSIMHYGLHYGGQKVIEVLQSGIDETKIGRGTALTPTDISGVNYIYPTSTTPPPPPPPAPVNETFSGSFSTSGLTNYHPGTTGFSYAGGTINASLSGPSNTDFDLYLQRRSGSGKWNNAARSTGSTSSKSLSYAAGAGTYRWRVYSSSGSGNYTLVVQK